MVACCDVKIGDLKHSIILQEATRTDDGAGGTTRTTWTTFKPLRCSLKTKSGGTRLFAQARDMPVTHTLVTRYFSTWSPGNANKRRFLFGTRVFEILFVNNIEERNRFLEYTIKENTPT